MARSLSVGVVPLELVPPQQLRQPDPEPHLAKGLREYTAELIDPLEKQEHPAAERIVRAFVLIQIRYFRLADKTTKAREKRALHQVFAEAHARLIDLWEREQEIRISRPPKAALIPPPAPVVEAPRRKTVAEALMEAMGS